MAPHQNVSIDEGWIDLSPCPIRGRGAQLAKQIQQQVFFEIGLTISIGVADNKIAAKLVSEYFSCGSK
jgi:DNA polymerase-4